MASYTASDFCQGHGGSRDCDYDPDYGTCLHGEDFDHGVVSYCDGSCTEARIQFNTYRHTRLAWKPAPSASEITLEVYSRDVSYNVVFEGPQAEERALAYVSARQSLCFFSEVYDRPFSHRAFPKLAAYLHPTCHHGMAAELCMDSIGPNHFGTHEQELAGLL